MRKIQVFGESMKLEVPIFGIAMPYRSDYRSAENYEEEYNKRKAKILEYPDGIDIDKIKDDSDLVKLLDEKKAIFKIYRQEPNPKEDEEIRNDLKEHDLDKYGFRVMVMVRTGESSYELELYEHPKAKEKE